MKQSILIIFLMLFFLVSCKSKKEVVIDTSDDVNYIPYYLKVYEADSLFIVGNYQLSFKVLDSLFKKFKPLNMNVYSEYETYLASAVQTNATHGIRDKVKDAFLEYGCRVQDFRQDPFLNKAIVLSGYTNDMIDVFSKKYQNNLDVHLRSEVEDVLEKDQQYRQGIEKKIDTLRYIDSVNIQIVKSILKRKGYPGRAKIGDYSLNQKNVDLSSFFLHVDRKNMEEYFLPILLQYVKSGECQPYVYAIALDKLLLNSNDKRQKYGTMFKNSNELMPLLNPKKVDSLRKSIGLPHIKYERWRLKIKYNATFD